MTVVKQRNFLPLIACLILCIRSPRDTLFGGSQFTCQMCLLTQQDDPSGITCEEPEMIQTQTLTWPHATGSHGVAGIH